MRHEESIEKDKAQMLAHEGDERLSGSNKGTDRRQQSAAGAPEKKKRKERDANLGRALRTVYDDMLREEVPEDFLNLLRKLD